MADLGTLWFGADIDIAKLKQKIQDGNQSILDALKMNYDPKSYKDMVDSLKSQLSSETFQIKISTDAQNVAQNLRQQLNGATSGLSGVNLSGLTGINGMTRDILNQREAVRDTKAEVDALREAWQRAAAQYGKTSSQAQQAHSAYQRGLRDLRESRYELSGLNIERGKAQLAQKALTEQTKQASAATKQLNSDSIRLNTTLAGGIHISTQFGSALSNVFAVDAIRQFLNSVIDIGGQLEKQRISMGAIIGDTARANELFEEIKDLAVKSPFGVVELDQYSKQLAAYGIEQSKLFDMTKRLADISAGAGQDIGRLALALGHVKSATYLTGITLRQFSMNNIPMLKMLADYYTEVEKRAVSTAEVQKRISKRQVSYDDVIEQIKRMTDEGGQFYNMQEKISESLSAKFKNLRDSFDIMYGEIAESRIGDWLKSFASVATDLSRNWKQVMEIAAIAAGYFGFIRVAILACNQATLTYSASVGKLAVMTRNLTEAEVQELAMTGQIQKQHLLNAVASGRLSVEQAKLAASYYHVTEAQLREIATSGKVNKGLISNALATSSYSVAQLRMIANMRIAQTTAIFLGNRFSWLQGIFIRLRLAGMGIANAFTSIGASIVKFVPHVAAFAAISAVIDTFVEGSRKAEEAEERMKSMGEIASEAYRNLQEVREKFKVGASAGMTDDEMQTNITEMIEHLQNYSKTAKETFNHAFEVDAEGKSIHSLSEQYEILAKAVDTTTEAYRAFNDIRPMVERALNINTPDEGFFKRLGNKLYSWILPESEKSSQRDLTEGLEYYVKTVKEASVAEQLFLRNRLEVQSLLSSLGFVEAVDLDNASLLRLIKTIRDTSPELFQSFFSSLDGGVQDSLINMENAWSRMDKGWMEANLKMRKSGEDLYETFKTTYGEDMSQWPEGWREMVKIAMDAATKDVRGFADMSIDYQNMVRNSFLHPFQIEVDADEAKTQVNNLLVELQNLVGTEWTVPIGIKGVSVVEDLKSAGKTYKEAVDDLAVISKSRQKIENEGRKNTEAYKKVVDEEKKLIAKRDKASQTITHYGGDLPKAKSEKASDAAARKAETAAKKAEREAEKRAKERTKQAEAQLKIEEELAKQRIEMEDALAEAYLATIENNAERERAERENEFRKQKRQIEKQAEEWKKKAFELAKKEYEANPNNKKVSFYDTPTGQAGWQGIQLNNTQLKTQAAQYKKLNADRSRWEKELYEQQVQYMRDYFKQYGTFQEQKYAIEKEYDKKIAEERDAWRKKSLVEEKKKALNAIDIELLRTEIDWSTMFEGIGGALEDEMKATLDKIEQYMRTDAFKKRDAKEKAEYVKMRNDLYEKTGSGVGAFDFSIYGKIAEDLKTYQQAVLNHKQALIVHTEALNKLKEIDAEVEEAKEKLKKAVTEEEKRIAKKNLEEAQKRQQLQQNVVNGTGKQVKSTETQVVESQGAVTRNLSAAEKALGNFSDALNQLSSGTLKGFGDGIANLISAIGGKKGEGLAGLGEIGGIIGAIFSIIDALGDAPAKFFDDLFDKISTVIEEVIKQLPQIIESVVKGAGNIVGSVFKGFGGLITNLFGGGPNYDEYNKALDKWGNILDVWRDTIDYQRELMEKAYGTNVIELQNKTVEQLNKVVQAAKEQYLGWMNSGAGTWSHSHGHDINETANWRYLAQTDPDMLKWLGASVWQDAEGKWHDEEVGDLRKLAEMDWKDLERFKNENAQFWATIHEDVRGYLETVIEAGRELEEATKRANEKLTTTTEENVFEDFLNSLYDLADGSQDVFDDIATNWQKMVNRMVINNFIASEFQGKLKDWYEELVKLQGERDNGLSDKEYQRRLNELQSTYNGYVADAQDKMATFTELGIIKPIEEAILSTDDLRSAFSNLVTDSKQDMEEWGKSLKNSIINNLIEAMVFGDEFKEWLKGITDEFNDLWEKKKAGKISSEEFAASLAALNNDIAGKGQEVVENINNLKKAFGYEFDKDELKGTFSGLHDTFLDTLTDMEEDADAFKKRIQETMIKDLIDKRVLGKAFTIDDKTFDSFDAYLYDWNERYTKAIEEGNDEAIELLLEELVRARQITIEAAEEYRDKLKGVTKDTTFEDMSDNWVSSLMDMSKTAEDWAQDIGRTMAEKIIKEMLVPTLLQPLLTNLQNVFNGVMDKAVTKDEEGKTVYNWDAIFGSDDLNNAIQELVEAYPQAQEFVKKIMDLFHLDTTNYKYSGFSNLGDSILDSLKSAEGSLSDWSKSMGQQMAEDMAKAYIDATYGGRMDELNERWQKALELEDPEARETELEAIRKELEALYQTMDDDTHLQGLIDKFRELAENPFKDMAADFASAVMDMEHSAEEFANNIARNMTQAMIENSLRRQFQPEIDALGDAYREALDVGDAAAIEAIRQRIIDLAERMGEAAQPFLDAIKDIGKETDTTFSDMTDSWVSALMDMESTAEDFAESVGKTMAQKIITELIAPMYLQPILDAMQAAYNAAISVPGATIYSVMAAMTPFLDQVKNVYNEIKPMVEEIFGTFNLVKEEIKEVEEEIEYALSDMKSEFTSTLMDMQYSAEDWATNISKILAKAFIEKYILGSAFDARMEEWQQRYESILGSGMSEEERKRMLKLLRDEIIAARDDYAEQAATLMDLFGLGSTSKQEATMNMADKITYDQAEQLLGINLAQELTLEQILATLQGNPNFVPSEYATGAAFGRDVTGNDEQSKLINATLTSMAQLTQQSQDNILTQVAMANSHLQMIRDYAKTMRDEMVLHLASMDSKLSYLRNW